VKKCLEYEVEGARPTGGQKRTWREVVQRDCQVHKLNREDAWIVVDGGSRKSMIDDQYTCEWLTPLVPDRGP